MRAAVGGAALPLYLIFGHYSVRARECPVQIPSDPSERSEEISIIAQKSSHIHVAWWIL